MTSLPTVLPPRRRLRAMTGPVVTIGNFDGVHRGHQTLVRAVVSKARATSTYAAAVIFDPHPIEVLHPERAPKRLTSIDHRKALLEACGIDRVFVLGFTRELASWEPETFVSQVLSERLDASTVQVGEGFRFGRGGTGDLELLKTLGEARGISVFARTLVPGHSSTRVRELIARGDVVGARQLLGRPHRLPVRMMAGRGATGTGMTLPLFAMPPRGLYDAVVRVDNDRPRRVLVGMEGEGEGVLELKFDAADHVRTEAFEGRSAVIDLLAPSMRGGGADNNGSWGAT